MIARLWSELHVVGHLSIVEQDCGTAVSGLFERVAPVVTVGRKSISRPLRSLAKAGSDGPRKLEKSIAI